MTNPLEILILDDDVDVAEALADILELHGHNVTIVHNGKNAIEAFTNNDFDVGFFDVRMPGMNGVESFIEIKKIKPDAKVFMMTGFSVEQLLEQALEHGALGVLRKPFDADELIAKLDGVNEGLIVVADADSNFSNSIVPALEANSYEVLVAKTGTEALKLIDSKATLLVLDLDLPILSGLEVFLELKKRGINVPTIVVMTEKDGHADDVEKLRKQSVSGFFQKPCNPTELVEMVSKISGCNTEAEVALSEH